MANGQEEETSGRGRGRGASAVKPGLGVDALGFPVIDPTKNVEDLVEAGRITAALVRAADNRFLDAQLIAQEKLQNFAREAEGKLQTFAREMESKFQNMARDAETGRIDQLAALRQMYSDQLAQLRQVYEQRIADMLSKSVDSTQSLVANQLTAIQGTFNERVSKLEEFRWSMVGKTSASDPAIADALVRLTTGLATLRTNTDEMFDKMGQQTLEAMAKMSRDNTDSAAKLTTAIATLGSAASQTTAKSMGRGEIVTYIMMAVLVISQVATVLTFTQHIGTH